MSTPAPRVLIVAYGMGNVGSVRRAFEECGAEVMSGCASEQFLEASHVVIPGVGAFAEGMAQLNSHGIPSMIERFVVQEDKPLLGICLGMQLLANDGIEGGLTEGLGLVGGHVVPLQSKGPGERIPHVGWNEVHHDGNCPLLESIPSGKDFYFVHSYAYSGVRADQIVGRTPYCGSFPSVIRNGSIWGTQFHPEKSQRAGMRLIRNFLALR